MFRALSLSAGQLGDPRILKVLAKSLALTVLIFAGLGWLLATLLTGFDPCGIVSSRSCAIGGMEGGVAATVLALLLVWLLFPAVAIGVLGLFADEVVAAVEERHYPDAAARAKPPGWGASIRMGLASAGRLIGWNLLALPFYLLLLLTAFGPLVLFLLVNALVLGRDLGEMVAVRHLDNAAKREWLAATRGRRALMGLLVTGLFMIPVLNLLAPVLGAGIATHLYHGRTQ